MLMTDQVSAMSKDRPRRGLGMAVVGITAGVAGFTVAWLSHRQQRHVEATHCGLPSGSSGVGDVADNPASTSRVVPSPPTLAAADNGVPRHGVAAQRMSLKDEVARRPGAALAVTAVVVAVATVAGTVLVTAPGADESTSIAPPRSTSMPHAGPVDLLIEPSSLVPMHGIEAVAGSCTADGVCTSRQFTMELEGNSSWQVTGVGFRPLEVIPGRRVTRLRWELHGRDTVVFFQDEDSADEHAITYTPVGGAGSRARRITAVVEASLPASGAALTYLPPFSVYGFPDEADTLPDSTTDTDTAVRSRP